MIRDIQELYESDRPREKLTRKGPGALKTHELIAIILGSGSKAHPVMKLSKNIELALCDDISTVSVRSLKSIQGVGTAKACQIVAAIELSRRFLPADPAHTHIKSAEDAVALLLELSDKKQEYFVVLTLNGAGRLIEKRIISIGTLNQSLVHPREVFADAITDRAAGIIIAHNHPSGSQHPSEEDITITRRLSESGKLLGIELVDHLIITKNGHYSFRSQGLL